MSDDDCSPTPATGCSPAVEVIDPAWIEALPECRALCRDVTLAVLSRLGFETLGETLEIGVRLSDDAELRGLNRQHRGIDAPTNVLSFPASDCEAGVVPAPPPAGAPLALGDVVLGFETVCAEAGDQHKPLADHLRHLVVHGVLHLAGYDHETTAGAAAMEALETSILDGFGVADPYGAAPETTPAAPPAAMTKDGPRP